MAWLESVEVAEPVYRPVRRFGERERALWQWLQEQHEAERANGGYEQHPLW